MFIENFNLEQVNNYLSELIDCMPVSSLSVLSDDAFCAVAQMTVAFHNLITSCELDDTFGNRKIYESWLDRLYGLAAQRCENSRNLARQSKLAAAMYDILYGQMRNVDYEKKMACYDEMLHVADVWHATTSHENEFIIEYYVLRCIVNMFRHVGVDERNKDELFRYLEQRVSEWGVKISPEGFWPGIPDYEALCRLDIMVRNSDACLDESYDTQIESSRRNYCRNVLGRILQNNKPVDMDFCILNILYEVLRTGEQDYEALNEIACYAEHQLSVLPEKSKYRLFCLKIRVDHTCMTINEAIKRQMLARTA